VPNKFTRELKEALLRAAEEVGEVEEVPILDKDGKPTGKMRYRATGKNGLVGYLRWASAGVVGVTFNDLRGTAATRLALVGCTEAEIAAIRRKPIQGRLREVLRDRAALLSLSAASRRPGPSRRPTPASSSGTTAPK
jgi:hypothetical protein